MKIKSLFRVLNLLFITSFLIMGCTDHNSVFVSPEGSDQNDGTIKSPFLSASKALLEARKSKAIDPDKDIVINFRAGTYRIDETLELDSLLSGLCLQAYKDEKVIFSGGISLPIELIQQSDTIYSIDSPKGNVWEVDLRDIGVTDFGEIHNVGFSRPYGPSWGEVFVNNRPMRLAQWPNNSMVAMGEVLDAGSKPSDKDFSNRGGVFHYDSTRVNRWRDEKNPWIGGHFNAGFADDMVRVASIDTLARTITTNDPTYYGYAHGEAWQKWYGVNLLSELDTLGEYYIDRDLGKLCFISPTDEDIHTLEFSMLESPFITLSNVSNVTIKGITFTVSRGMGVSLVDCQDVTIDACCFKNLGSLGVAIGMGVEPFEGLQHEVPTTPKPHIIGSLQEYLYHNSTYNRQGGKNNSIINCEFSELGAGGISLGGGNRLTLDAGNNRVENCLFYATNRIEKMNRPAVHITGVGNVIRNCEMHSLSSMAILMHGNNHLIEYNYIHDVCLEVEDMGAFYYGRNPSERGTVLQYNYFENIPTQYSTFGIYHDDASCGLIVTGNIFNRAGIVAAYISGGSDNDYTNNMFINCKAGVRLENRLSSWGNWLIDEKGLFQTRLEAVNYQSPPYSVAYPAIVNYFDKVGLPTANYVIGNLFANVDEVLIGKKESIGWQSNVEVSDKPIDIRMTEMGKLHLTESEFIFEQIPALKNIPINKIGLNNNGKLR